jgi:hypothetical protein
MAESQPTQNPCRTPVVQIRGITDTADHDAPAAFEVDLGQAMGNIARLLSKLKP